MENKLILFAHQRINQPVFYHHRLKHISQAHTRFKICFLRMLMRTNTSQEVKMLIWYFALDVRWEMENASKLETGNTKLYLFNSQPLIVCVCKFEQKEKKICKTCDLDLSSSDLDPMSMYRPLKRSDLISIPMFQQFVVTFSDSGEGTEAGNICLYQKIGGEADLQVNMALSESEENKDFYLRYKGGGISHGSEWKETWSFTSREEGTAPALCCSVSRIA